MARLGFPNAYCLSKRLAEELLCDAAMGRGNGGEGSRRLLPVAIVRPSIVGSVSDDGPLPGYVGNSSGATGGMLAIATGIARWSTWHPLSVMDIVPGERVAGAALLAAAQLHHAASPPPVAAVHARAVDFDGSHRQQQQRQKQLRGQPPRLPLIVHAGGSGGPERLTAATFYSSVAASFGERPPRWRLHHGDYPDFGEHSKAVASPVARAALCLWDDVRVGAAAALLAAAGDARSARRLWGAHGGWRTMNTPELVREGRC